MSNDAVTHEEVIRLINSQLSELKYQETFQTSAIAVICLGLVVLIAFLIKSISRRTQVEELKLTRTKVDQNIELSALPRPRFNWGSEQPPSLGLKPVPSKNLVLPPPPVSIQDISGN